MRPTLSSLDLALVALYAVLAVVVGALFARQAGRGLESFFVGDRKLPWWLAGTSMVATTFAADTPLAVTGIVARDGVSGNWIWWSWAIAHLSATFFFARMWRRSEVITDAEITELRYGGRPAAFLRAVKALYFGLFVNCLTMAWVIAAMVKISRAFFDVQPAWVIAGCVALAVGYTVLGGFRSVVVTDLVQFALGMGGALLLAVLVVQSLGGLGTSEEARSTGEGLIPSLERAVAATGDRTLDSVLDFVPPADHPTLPPIFFAVLLIAGWWRYAEGNGYLVQRFAACRTEGEAQGASLWFAVAHNALRPWPWILVGLASLVIYPRLPGAAPSELVAKVGDGGTVRVTPASLDVATGGTLEIVGLPSLPCTAEALLDPAVPQPPSPQTQRASAPTAPTAPLIAQVIPRAGTDGEPATARFGGFPASGIYALSLSCPSPVPGAPALTARVSGLRVELKDREMAYPLIMGRTLPSGLLGLVVASLLAAFMSTIDTHTNWGASYLVQDLYRRFLRPDASQHHYVQVSRAAIVLMAALAGVSALFIQDIASVWRFLVTLGAGLGSVAAARWYWPRVTPWAELAAMAVTTVLAVALELLGTATLFGGPNPFFVAAIPGWLKIVAIAGASLATWIPVALLGPANDPAVLRRFANKVLPPGPAWAPWRDRSADPLRPAVLRFAAGLVVVFGTLFGLGDLLLGSTATGLALLVVAALMLAWIIRSGRDAPRRKPASG